MMYDIIIVGAGPSGATLARLLGNKYKILLLDRRELLSPQVGSFEKCCGGLIAPDAQYMLAKMGLGVPKNVLVGPQLFTVRTIDIENSIEKFYQRHYINIDRERFDAWLVSLIPPSVDICCGSLFRSFEVTEKSLEVVYTHKGNKYIESSKYLVGADGATSLIRKKLAPNIIPKSYIAVQEWFNVERNQPYFSAVFDSHISDFYSWTIPKENSLLIGAALHLQDDAHYKFDQLKKKLIKYGYKLGESIKREGAFINRPQSKQNIYLGKGNILLIGEAAGWISPTSAEGLSYAFKSSLAAADSLQDERNNPLKEYYNKTKHIKRNIILKNIKSPFMYNSLLRKAVMKSGVMSMSIYKN